ncbi:putative bifunctional diguanylate cyclase/phosphodiesterase [Microvirga aerilata]
MFIFRLQFRTLNQGLARLSLQNERFNAALNNMSQGLCMFDADQRLIISNRRMVEVLRVPEHVLAKGASLGEMVSRAEEASMDLSVLDTVPILTDSRGFAASLRQTSDGRSIAIAYQRVTDGGWVATYEDVTERKQHEERVAYLANHDTLTGLPNRARFQLDLNEALAESAITGRSIALLCLDLDRFKAINDTLGHHVGDLLLQEVAQRIMGVLRHGDTVARLGGDEFSIITRNMRVRQDAAHLAERIIEAVRAPYDLEGHRIIVETSIGIAVCPDDSVDGEQLLRQADFGLYRTKSDGRGSYRFFEAGMDNHIQARLMLETDLRKALAADEFELHFQPIVSLESTDEVRCYEALLRWKHPVRGMIPPGDFIPIAEEIGVIVPLGEWVIHEACRQAVAWNGTARVAVNLSPIQFKRGDVVGAVHQALTHSGLAPQRLELEITESVLMDDGGRTQEILTSLHKVGVRIAMDDFGTGYSSLSYLRKFSFDKIKIDRSFVKDIHIQQNRDIINAIVELGRSLGMTVTAEGIETAEQLELLRGAGCHEGQGYLFSRPRPSYEFEGLLFAPDSMRRVARPLVPLHVS